MMTKCPECGSTEIVPDLIIFAAVSGATGALAVSLVDPAQKGEPAHAGFRVAVCGACGHTEIYTRFYQRILDAHKKGYVTHQLH